jgi:tripartite-type tricarboxylate transporter receptor subunit TctC
MAGAGGAIGANWLGEIAAPDGLTMSYFTGLATDAATAKPSIKVDIAKFEFVGSGPGISVAYARTDLGGGIAKPEDLLQKKDFWVGGLAVDEDKDLRIRLQLDLLGLPYKYITGYPGSADTRLALMRNELQLNVESMPAYRASVEPDLVKSGQVIPLWYDINDEANALTSPETAGIPALPFGMFYKKVEGKEPTGIKWEIFDRLNQIGTNFERILVMPPGSPKAAVTALKAALQEVNEDKDFQQDALTTIKFVPHYTMDAEKERLFYEKLDPDPKFKAFIDQYIEEGQALNGKR